MSLYPYMNINTCSRIMWRLWCVYVYARYCRYLWGDIPMRLTSFKYSQYIWKEQEWLPSWCHSCTFDWRLWRLIAMMCCSIVLVREKWISCRQYELLFWMITPRYEPSLVEWTYNKRKRFKHVNTSVFVPIFLYLLGCNHCVHHECCILHHKMSSVMVLTLCNGVLYLAHLGANYC